MKILHVLSQVQITGAETHALTLAHAQAALGHEVMFVSDELHAEHPFRFFPVPIHRKNSSYAGRLKNVWALRKILSDQKIDIVHSHSRAANLIAQIACRALPGKKIPFVTTVHGRWRNTFAFRKFPCLGSFTVCMCPYLKRYLAEDIGFPPGRVEMIPNSVDTSRFSPAAQEAGSITILYIGRFSGQKGNALRFILRKVIGDVLNLFPDAQMKILADDPSKEDLAIVDGLNGGMDFLKAVEIIPPPKDIAELYKSASVVIGAGRVVLEAMSSGVPALAIGESSAPGLLTEENFESAFDSNFGDCGEWNLFKGQETRLIGDLEKVLKDVALRKSLSLWGRNMILSRFDSNVSAPQILEIYKKAIGLK